MSEVKLEKIVKSFGKTTVVHGIDLKVASNEFVVLVGPSGCGKSTTLRMIAGLEEISDGSLSIGDRVVNSIAPKDRDVAMVFQNYALYPHLDVAENIAFGLKIRKTPADEITKTVADVAEILGLTNYLERRPADLSGGQRQRVAMGRAIVRHPAVFLFDEPLSNLDAKLRTQMRAEIKRLHKRLGVTSIYVTHDQVEAMTLADRIVVMRDGRIEQIGTPMDLFNNPLNTFVAGFIGSPPMNQLKGKLVQRGGNTFVDLHAGAVRVADNGQLSKYIDKDVIMGVRPEHVSTTPSSEHSAITIELDLIEPLGSEALLHTHVDGKPFVAKTETHGEIDHLNALTSLYIDEALVSLFDADSGMAFSHPKGGAK